MQYVVDYDTCPVHINSIDITLTRDNTGSLAFFDSFVSSLSAILICDGGTVTALVMPDDAIFVDGMPTDLSVSQSKIDEINALLDDLDECSSCQSLEFRATVARGEPGVGDPALRLGNWSVCVALTDICLPCISSVDFSDLTPCSTDMPTFTVTIAFDDIVDLYQDIDVPLELSVDDGLIDGSVSIIEVATVTAGNSSVVVGPFTYDPNGTAAGTIVTLSVGDDSYFMPGYNPMCRLLCPCQTPFELQDCSNVNCGTCNTTVTIVNKTP